MKISGHANIHFAMNNNILRAWGFLTLALATANAKAGNTDPFPANILNNDSSKVVDIDEIVITPQAKDAFKLRKQPLSSSSFSATDLSRLSVNDMRELSVFVPSFVMPNYGSRLTSSIYIRGIGSRINSPAVSMYVDDLPIVSKGAMNFHLYQISRTDVLRGPQGTLYGQNSEGGLIRIYTKNPQHYQGTDIKISAGNHFYRNIEAAHHHKFNSKVAMSVAGFYNGTNGFLRNSTTDKKADDGNEAGGKLKLVYTPSGRLTLNFVTDYQYTNQNGFAYGQLNIADGTTASPASNRQSSYKRNLLNTGLHVNYQGNGYSINSVTSYQFLNDEMQMDQDYLPQDYMHLSQKQLQNAITEELSIKSENHSRWHWTVGAYASHQWTKTEAPVFFDEGITQPIANGIQKSMYNAILAAMAKQFEAQGIPQKQAETLAMQAIEKAGGVSLDLNMSVPGTFHTPQMNFALFHESNIDITDRLTATVGLRYDMSRTQITYNTTASMTMTANVMGKKATYTLSSALANKEHDAFNQLLPKFGLRYRIDASNSNLYAIVSKGYRAGGYNIQMFSDILQTELMANRQNAMRGDYEVPHTQENFENIKKTIAYKPETTWNYEVGAHLNLFSQSLHLDISAYLMQVHNQQLSVMAGNYGYGRRMVNAGKSQSCGLELTLRGCSINNHLIWNIGYGYTHAVFREYTDNVIQNNQTVTLDYRNKHIPYVPTHTLNANATYRQDFSHSFLHSLSYGLNMAVLGKIYWNEENTYAQNLYATLGARIDADFGAFSVGIWGKNLTDTRYNTFAVSSAATGTTEYFAQRGTPLQIGFDLSVHF